MEYKHGISKQLPTEEERIPDLLASSYPVTPADTWCRAANRKRSRDVMFFMSFDNQFEWFGNLGKRRSHVCVAMRQILLLFFHLGCGQCDEGKAH